MTGKLLIDGIDAYVNYGVFVSDGDYRDLITYPPLKAVDYNDWPEENGIEVNLSSPVLNLKEVSVPFCFISGFQNLITALSDQSYHEFNFAEIGRTYNLRLISVDGLKEISSKGTITLHFADDFPLQGYSYSAPSATFGSADYALDSNILSKYGLTVLEGAKEEILRPAQVKENLFRNIKSLPGAIYDGAVIKFREKDVNINLFTKADLLNDLWSRYDAFLYDLTRAGKRILTTPYGSYDCYFKSSRVTEFHPLNKIWLQFSVTMVFI